MLALALAASIDASAADAASIDLPAQPLGITLDSLAKSTNTKLVYADSMVQNLQAGPVKGNYTVQQALDKVLGQNDLQYEQVGDGVIAVKKTPPKAKSD
ncbi:MAG: hypothetical protein BVN35_11460 [Proteobacteria bacterium ST_bin11]|nr:MAG: hypothetical protein BVN35_11460 [Proteobacteria bacterium ST_bin11]